MIILILTKLLVHNGLDKTWAEILAAVLSVTGIVFLSWAGFYIARHYLMRFVRHVFSKMNNRWGDQLIKQRVLSRVSFFAPLLIAYYLAPLLDTSTMSFTGVLSGVIVSISVLLMLVVVTLTLNNVLNLVAAIYHDSGLARHRPIKSYVQVAKIFLYGLSAILIIATLLKQSPLTLLTSLGALTAILLLIFKDSILGFVASVQISTYDMVRIGDWIEIPKFGVDGDVLDISLNTIKVQNFDKTVVTIPSHSILNEGVKNWRGMQESGGRRIKRAVHIDMHSIKFCNQEMLERFSRVHYIAPIIKNKLDEINKHNATLNADLSVLVNGRHMTNVGIFRSYLEAYLRDHPSVHHQLTFLVRQLKPTEKGLPIEIYIFTNDTNWNRYESIQADIFDHILAIIPEFELSVFQDISSISGNQHYQNPYIAQPMDTRIPTL